jgi:sulfonate dioxygenase
MDRFTINGEHAVMASKPLYPAYLPVRPEGFTPVLDIPAFDAEEPGLRADHGLPGILSSKASLKNITPRVGTEIRDLQLSQLTTAGLDQVALLAAQRGVLVFLSLIISLVSPISTHQ